jgi:protein-disulfide isomerase
MNVKVDAIMTSTLVICAIITSGALVKRAFFPGIQTGQMIAEHKPILIPHWQDYLDKGIRMGPQRAKVQFIEFADFECPYCGTFHKTLKILRGRYPDQVSLEYVHFPLPMHRFAVPAARAAECAGDQGRFEAMYDQLFDGQEFLGLKPWSDYASAAAVPDLAAFDACVKRTESVTRIDEGKELGRKLDVQGTPTLVVNGWKLGQPPSPEELDTMVKAVLAGHSPVPVEDL